jgi:UDP-2-acetamido-2,6-beta-L-arabino-hexul-4-ose reductase
MLRVGITGQSGFIGTHLYNYLNLRKTEIQMIPYKDEYFSNSEQLMDFVSHCDTIVHLAAMNRHNNPDIIYNTNIGLVKKLIGALEQARSKVHVIFSSSTQEEHDNPYGKSKYEGRILLEEWARRNNAQFTGLIIPNVFGPFGNPFYNSVIATFCYQLTHSIEPHIEIDGLMKLIYVNELIEEIYYLIIKKPKDALSLIRVKNTTEIKVSGILDMCKNYKSLYFENGILPNLDDRFGLDLFNTFITYIDIKNYFPVRLNQKVDNRGSFVETIKLNSGGQVSFSTTKPGITRGNHFHTQKAERFIVIKGKARIQLKRIGTTEVLNFELDGSQPSYVDMPVWYTHNITNIGDDTLYTLFWINEPYRPENPDTFMEMV